MEDSHLSRILLMEAVPDTACPVVSHSTKGMGLPATPPPGGQVVLSRYDHDMASPNRKRRTYAHISKVATSLLISAFVGMISGKAGNYLNDAAIFYQAGNGDAVITNSD
jgi:hypothetical protein